MTDTERKILISQMQSLKDAIQIVDDEETLKFRTEYLKELFYHLNRVCLMLNAEEE